MGRSSKTRRARFALGLVCAATMLGVLAPTPARADLWCWLFGSGCDGRGASRDASQRDGGAPEIDPGTLAGAMALAGGGAAMLGDRLRRRRR